MKSHSNYQFYKRFNTIGMMLTEADALAKSERALRRWHELECNGDIEFDDSDKNYYWQNATAGKQLVKCRRNDLYSENRVNDVLNTFNKRTSKNYSYYIQSDPRGCALYIYDTLHELLKTTTIDNVYSAIGLACSKD